MIMNLCVSLANVSRLRRPVRRRQLGISWAGIAAAPFFVSLCEKLRAFLKTSPLPGKYKLHRVGNVLTNQSLELIVINIRQW
jgi:hypothetical protein